METRTSTIRVAAATLLAPIAWGTTYVTITELLPEDRPLLVAALRLLPAGVALLGFGLLRSRWRPGRSELSRLSVIAFFNFALFFPLLIVGVYRLPGGVAAATGGLQPLLVLLIASKLDGYRPERRDLAIGAAAAIGVALIVLRPNAGIDPIGVLAALGANVSFAVAVVLTKRWPASENRFAATGAQMLGSGAILLPIALMLEGAPASMTATNLAGFAYLSIGGTAVAFVLWFSGIRKLPVSGPPLLGLAAPVTGAVLGWALLGESLSALQLLGFAITISAIAYGALQPAVSRPKAVDGGSNPCPQPA